MGLFFNIAMGVFGLDDQFFRLGSMWEQCIILRDFLGALGTVGLELRKQGVHKWLREPVSSIGLRRNMCEVKGTFQNVISHMFIFSFYML